MKRLVKDIVELDLQAQAKLGLLNKEKEELSLELNQKKQRMEENYQAAILQIRKDHQKASEAQLKTIEASFKIKEAALKAELKKQFENHEKVWLEEMLKLITQKG